MSYCNKAKFNSINSIKIWYICQLLHWIILLIFDSFKSFCTNFLLCFVLQEQSHCKWEFELVCVCACKGTNKILEREREVIRWQWQLRQIHSEIPHLAQFQKLIEMLLLCYFDSKQTKNSKRRVWLYNTGLKHAASDLFHKLEKYCLVITLAHFRAIFLISFSIALQIKPFLNWFSILCNISWFWSLWYGPQSLFHFNLRPAGTFFF